MATKSDPAVGKNGRSEFAGLNPDHLCVSCLEVEGIREGRYEDNG